MKFLKQLPLLIFIWTVSLGTSGCDSSLDIQNWVDNVSKLKGSTEEQLSNAPYRRPQHEAFKRYFSELNQMALALKNDVKLKERYNEATAKGDINLICQKSLLNRSRWESLIQNCTRNRFFLCSEEVRAYPELILGLRDALRPELKQKFDQAQNCQAASR